MFLSLVPVLTEIKSVQLNCGFVSQLLPYSELMELLCVGCFHVRVKTGDELQKCSNCAATSKTLKQEIKMF